MITRLETIYTGGGIYIYTGQIDTGEYFLAADDYEECVLVLDADPYAAIEDCTYTWWQEAHGTRSILDRDAFIFWQEMLSKTCDLGDMIESDRDRRLEQLLDEYPQYESYIDRIFRTYGDEFFGKIAMNKITSGQIEEARCHTMTALAELTRERGKQGNETVKELFCNYIFEKFM